MHRRIPPLSATLGILLAPLAGLADESRSAPGSIATTDLADFADLEPARRHLVESALDASARMRFSKYIFGSADPAQGGFDCSGAVYYLLQKIGIECPRSSAGQFDWIKAAGHLREVPSDASSLEHQAFADLQPGDLLFWSGTYQPTDGRTNKITHVQIYLGREKDGGPVMIGSSDGRSYRGKSRCGFGVFDFKIPRSGSKARFVGYGPPPGLKGEPDEPDSAE